MKEPAPRAALRDRPLHPVAFVVLLGFLSSMGPAAFDLYLPALPQIADELGATQSVVGLSVAFYLIGLGGGQLLGGPISDRLGRRRPILFSLAAFGLASLLCAVSPSVLLLIVARLFQGLAAATGMVVARAVIRDLYAGAAGARLLSRIVLIYGLAPVLAPVLGAQILLVTNWRGLFWLLVAFAILVGAAAALLLPETLPPERRRHSLAHTRADFGTLLRNRGFVGYALAVGLAGAALVSYVSASPFVIQEVYGASTQLYGAIYGAMAVGILIGSQINAHLLRRHSPQRLLGIAVALLLVDGALMLALTAAGLPLWAICPTYFLLMFSWGFIPSNAVALAMLEHPERAGTASALVGLCQYGMSALAVPLVGAAGEGSALPMAAAVFVSALLCALVLRYLAATTAPAPRVAV